MSYVYIVNMKSLLAQFSVQLRHNREACGLSQQELAERIKIGYRTYQRYETGEATPSLDVVFQLANELKFKLDEMFSPEKLINRNLDVKFFNEENEKDFLNNELVSNSQILKLASKDLTNGIETILKDPLFSESPYYMGVTTFRNVTLNNAVRDRLGFKSNIIATTTATEFVREQGVLWATMILNQNKFAIEKRSFVYPVGPVNMVLYRILIEQNNHYAMLNVVEITNL